MSASPSLVPPREVRLPCSSSRLQRNQAYLKLLSSVGRYCSDGADFQGRIYPPGARLSPDELGLTPVVLECAGPLGEWRRGKRRDTLYILWQYDFGSAGWRELGRAQAINWEWALSLREPAWQALHPDQGLYDVLEKGKRVADQVMNVIEMQLKDERPDVRRSILASVYEQVAGRLAGAA